MCFLSKKEKIFIWKFHTRIRYRKSQSDQEDVKEKYNFPNILFFYLEKSVILGNGECRNKVRRLLVNKGKTDGRVQKKRQNGSKQKNEEKRRDSFRYHFDCGGRCVLFFRAPTVSDIIRGSRNTRNSRISD